MRLAVILFFCILFNSLRAQEEINKLPFEFPLEQLERERGKVHYNLNEMIKIIEDSIHHKNSVIIPEGANQFERILFTARRIQHNDSQLVAINLFQNLLEFEYHRNRGEELYIRLLLAKSLDYIDADQIAYQRLSRIFPELVEYIDDPFFQGFFLDQYADILVDINKLDEAIEVYYDILDISIRSKDSAITYDTRNNLGYTYSKLEVLDSAIQLFKLNQNPAYQSINPTLYAFSFGNCASIFTKREAYDSAIYYCKIEERLLKQIPTNEGLAILYQSLAKNFAALSLEDSAIYYYQLSNQYSVEIGRLDVMVDNYQSMINLQAKNASNQEIAENIEHYLILSGGIFDQYREQEKVKDARIAEFFNIYNRSIDSKQDFEILERYNDQLTYLVISLVVLLSLLILLMIYRYYNRRQLALINQDLITKNQDLAKYNQIITESNLKNETLLKELHHRVKNNLQIVSSLFRLQMNSKKLSRDNKEVFKIAQDRIHSISLLHKKIYQSEVISNLDFKSYLEELSYEVVESNPQGLKIELSIPSVQMSIDTALPLGLIFNELFTNSIKHAKVEDGLIIKLNYQKVDEKERFVYTDNGTQATQEIFKDLKEDSLGTDLIELLSRQIEAELSYESQEVTFGFYLEITGFFCDLKQAPIQNHDL